MRCTTCLGHAIMQFASYPHYIICRTAHGPRPVKAEECFVGKDVERGESRLDKDRFFVKNVCS